MVTDGDDKGTHTKVITEFNGYHVTNVITDPVMNKTIEVRDIYCQLTNSLLQLLKNRVEGMNVVGFFIAGSGKSGRVRN